MTCGTELQFSPLPDSEYAEICDKCVRRLDQRKNDDIWLSKIGVVFCSACYNKHTGLEVYR